MPESEFESRRQSAVHSLGDAELRAYALVAAGADLSGVPASALDRLVAVGLIVATPELPVGYRAVDPNVAVPRWSRALHDDARQTMDASESVHTFIPELSRAFRKYVPNIQYGGVEHVRGVANVNARIDSLMPKCERELLTAQPFGPRDEEALKESYRRDCERLDRGVAMRTIYLDSVRGDEITAEWARLMTAKGAQVRTLARPFTRMIVLDRREVITNDPTSQKRGDALVLHDPALAALMAAHFDAEWELAEPWAGEVQPEEVVLTEEQEAILAAMAEGLDPDAIGSRLPMQLAGRTVQSRKRELKELSNTSSDFQLGAWWESYQERRRRGLH